MSRRLHLLAVCCALLAVAPSSLAQTRIAEPPPSITDRTPDDPRRIPAWFREITTVIPTNFGRARTMAEAKLAEARAANDTATEAWALLAVASALRRGNNLPDSVTLSREALPLAERVGNVVLLFNANYIHGLCLNAAGDYVGAADYVLRGLAFADANNSTSARSAAVSVLGVIYEHLGDLKKALTYKTEALDLAEKMKDERAIAMYANNLAGLQVTLGDREAARRNLNRSLAYRRTEGNRTEIADLEEQLAMLDLAEGQAEKALATLTPILAQRRTLRGKVKLTNTLLCLSEVFQKLSRLDEALAHVEEARGNVEAIESRNLRASVYKQLAAVQEARGNLAEALAATRREFAEREAMAGETAQKRVAELQVQFETAKKDQDLARLARLNEVQAAEAHARTAQLAQNAAELRARDAEVKARDADLIAAALDLERSNATRLALGACLIALAVALAAIIVLQRTRLRTERRILAETQSARDAAEEADRIKTRFLGIATHDIRAPLGNIVMLSDTLRTTPNAPAERHEQIDLIGSEAQRVLSLVEDLLTVAALETGKLELRLTPMDLAEVLTAATGSLRWQADAKRQKIHVEPAARDTGVIEGDAARLHQVITNLVSNAIKFSPPGSAIFVALERAGDTLALSVRDQGPGLAAADIERLFAPFQRLSAQATVGTTSHGLGLSIAHEIVRLHGGTIRVESQPGQGATFRVELPALRPAS